MLVKESQESILHMVFIQNHLGKDKIVNIL